MEAKYLERTRAGDAEPDGDGSDDLGDIELDGAPDIESKATQAPVSEFGDDETLLDESQAAECRTCSDSDLNLLAGCRFLLAVLLFSACVTFAESATKSDAGGGIAAVAETNGLVLVDVASAFFVLAGFATAQVLDCSSAQQAATRAAWCEGVLGAWALVCLGAVASLVAWPFTTVPRETSLNDAGNVVLTVLEALVGLRVLETSQAPTAWHSLNPTAWPVHCLVLAGVWLPGARRLAIAMRKRQAPTHLLLPASVVTGIVVSSTLAVVNDGTNLFYAMASSSFYRLCEALAGMHTALLLRDVAPASPLMMCARRLRFWPIGAFSVLWWVELGAASPGAASAGVCLRVYYFSRCLRDVGGGLARGCVLGLLLAVHLHATEHCVHAHVTLPRLHALAAALVFAWPVSNVTHVSLNGSLSPDVVFANGPLLAAICAANSLAVGCLYDAFIYPFVTPPVVFAFRSAADRVRHSAHKFVPERIHTMFNT